MQKTKYVEVKPSDRLPAEKGEYIVVIDPETNFAGFFSFDPEDPADVEWWKETPEYWLQEVPDYEDEMKEMLDKAVQYLSECDWHPSYVETYSNFVMNANEFLTKHKTES